MNAPIPEVKPVVALDKSKKKATKPKKEKELPSFRIEHGQFSISFK
jgi:hypothetical protein